MYCVEIQVCRRRNIILTTLKKLHRRDTFCTCVGIRPGRVERTSPIELTTYCGHFICNVSWVVSTPRSPVPASLHLVALQLKLN